MKPRTLAWALAGGKLAIHLATLAPYGIFRDELYYIACSRHLGWGYVDQPPLSIAVLAGWRGLFGGSLEAMRVAPALDGAATVLLAGLLAIELGGGALAVLLAGLATLTAPLLLGMHHYYSMNSLDHLFWSAALLVFVRALRTARLRDWLLLGLLLGLGLENKVSVLWLGAGLAVALVATPERRRLRTPGPWLAAAVAVALFAPHVVWQIQNGFPTVEFARNALAHKYVRESPLDFLREAAFHGNLATVLVWLPGLVYALARPGRARLVAIALVVVTAILVVTRAKSEYLGAAFPAAFALGGVAWAELLAGRRAWVRRAVAATIAVPVVAFGALGAPFGLPVLSEDDFIAYERALGQKPKSTERNELADLPQFYADMHGWPELARLVEAATATLAPDERPGAVVWVNGNYGEAAAIEVLGRGVPPVACGHNSYWLWGPPPSADGRAVIVVGGRREALARYFDDLVDAGKLDCPRCMPYENGLPVYVGRGLHASPRALWPDEKMYI